MVEIIGRVMVHADLLHYAPRTNIAWHCERDHLRELQCLKPESQSRCGAFSRIPLSPVLSGEPPADLDTWGEMRVKVRDRQANEPGKRCDPWHFYRPEPESPLFKLCLNPARHRVALFWGQG
jgi:hypothetical protein